MERSRTSNVGEETWCIESKFIQWNQIFIGLGACLVSADSLSGIPTSSHLDNVLFTCHLTRCCWYERMFSNIWEWGIGYTNTSSSKQIYSNTGVGMTHSETSTKTAAHNVCILIKIFRSSRMIRVFYWMFSMQSPWILLVFLNW